MRDTDGSAAVETADPAPASEPNGEPGRARRGRLEGLRPERRQGHRHTRCRALPRRPAREDRQRDRGPRRLAGDQPRRGLRGHGTIRLRQVHAGADAHPPDRANRRKHPHHRPRRDGRGLLEAARAAPPHRLDGLPALRAARAPPRDRQRGLRPRDPGPRQAETARARRRDAAPRRPRGRRQPVPRSALGRHAAASRARPRLRGRSRAHALRRAVQRARPADPARHAGRGDPPPGRDRQDDALHHPRPSRGAATRRPHRDHARRRDRPARDSRGARGVPGQRVRRELRARHSAHPCADPALDHARRPAGRGEPRA